MLFTLVCRRLIFTADRQNFCRQRSIHPTYGSQDICLLADRDICTIKAEIEAKGYPIEEGVVARQGALGAMQSIYLRDADGNLIEIAVYEKNSK